MFNLLEHPQVVLLLEKWIVLFLKQDYQLFNSKHAPHRLMLCVVYLLLLMMYNYIVMQK